MISFWILGVILIASAVWTITAPKPVYSVIALLVNFATLAVLYLTLSAEFLAVMQIIVYSGAILMLFVFVIALLSSGVAPFSAGPNRLPKAVIPAIVIVLVSLGFLVFALARTTIGSNPSGSTSTLGPVGTADVFGSVADFGKALFTVQLLPFEITALILMVAVIGVVLLSGDLPGEGPPSKRHAREVEREMREAILRGGK